ncbi:MAG: hypothetical protein L6V87_09680 [Ruminococcus sp.]|nr:MAG: hypothetical protein L6V87_09680 [Ruminococcus sp.]
MTTSTTGSIIPSEFSQDIIHKFTELSGIVNRVSVVNSTGTYKADRSGQRQQDIRRLDRRN